MYYIYLIDDEGLVLDDMERSIPWVEHDLMVVGRASDPLKAVDEIAAMQPEVVFTDLKMPEISGLELIRLLQKKGLDCEFVVVSAYESFAYARELMQLGGFDYLIKPVKKEQYTELFARLLQRLEKKHPHKNLPSTNSNDLNEIILYLNRNLGIKHSLKEMAGKFNISANYICSLFSKHLSTTFSAYITNIRMQSAGQLLTATTKPVKEIATTCGYEDYFYFCRVFRDTFACTPTQYRNQT